MVYTKSKLFDMKHTNIDTLNLFIENKKDVYVESLPCCDEKKVVIVTWSEGK